MFYVVLERLAVEVNPKEMIEMKKFLLLVLMCVFTTSVFASPLQSPLFGYGLWQYDQTDMVFSNLPSLSIISEPELSMNIGDIKLDGAGGVDGLVDFNIVDALGSTLVQGNLINGSYLANATGILLFSEDIVDVVINDVFDDSNPFIASIESNDDIRINLSLNKYTGNILDSSNTFGVFSGSIISVPEPMTLVILFSGALLLRKRI